MKPVRLTMTAFGPFAEKTEISFDRIFEGGLFLIHGRTGAGKTSILDGICFALFGRPSSEEREKDLRGLRSDFASQQTLTETELIFAIGPDLYRVHRVPTQLVPKKRGEGFTEHKGSAELFKFKEREPEGQEWQPLAGKVEAVDAAIERLLGMNEKQFRQVVVLPQGRFREFLSSTSRDRQDILEKLFQTDRFSKLQDFISRRARETESRLKEQSQTLQTRLQSAGLERVDDIAARKQELNVDIKTTTERLSILRKKSGEIQAYLSQAKAKEEAIRRLRVLTDQENELIKKSEEMSSIRNRLNSARLWDPYFQLESALLETRTKTIDIEKRLQSAKTERKRTDENRQQIAKQILELSAQAPSLEDLNSERDALRETLVVLRDLKKDRDQLAEEQARLETLQRQNKSLVELKASLQSTINRDAEILWTAHRNLNQIENDRLKEQQRGVQRLELDFHRSEASRLAAALEPDEPCPVCGSLEHPHPAVIDSGIRTVTIVEINAAKSVYERLAIQIAKQRADRESRLSSFPVTESSRLQLSNPTTMEFFVSVLERLEGTLRETQEVVRKLQAGQTEMELRSKAIEKNRTVISEKKASINEPDRSIEEVMARGISLKTEIENRNERRRILDDSKAKEESDAARFEGLVAALEDERRRLQIQLNQQTGDLSDLKQSLLKSDAPEQPRERLSLDMQQKLQISLEGFQRAKTETESARREVEATLNRLPSSDTRSSLEIAIEMESTAKELSACEQKVGQTQTLFNQIDKLESEVTKANEQISLLRTEHERASRISALLNGDRSQNKLLVPLSRFVLQSRFDEVLEQANRRLGRMSRGVFQLRRPALSRNLRDSQGLELSVEDSVAGKERHAGSLSGGESFMAALSLALGLADVVQADLGGVKLDTVLIDEGFGTLDSESLDLAMKTLVDLQAGGRMVGIISHVQELKSQIHHQLEITKGPAGSRADWRETIPTRLISDRFKLNDSYVSQPDTVQASESP